MKKILILLVALVAIGVGFYKISIEPEMTAHVQSLLRGYPITVEDVKYDFLSGTFHLHNVKYDDKNTNADALAETTATADIVSIKKLDLVALDDGGKTKIFDTLHAKTIEITSTDMNSGITSTITASDYLIHGYTQDIKKLYQTYKTAPFSEEFFTVLLDSHIDDAEVRNYKAIIANPIDGSLLIQEIAKQTQSWDGVSRTGTSHLSGLKIYDNDSEVVIDVAELAINDFVVPDAKQLAAIVEVSKSIDDPNSSVESLFATLKYALSYKDVAPFKDITISGVNIDADIDFNDNLTNILTLENAAVKLENGDMPSATTTINNLVFNKNLIASIDSSLVELLDNASDYAINSTTTNVIDPATLIMDGNSTFNMSSMFDIDTKYKASFMHEGLWMYLLFGTSFDTLLTSMMDPMMTMNDTLFNDVEFNYTDKGLLPLAINTYASMFGATPTDALMQATMLLDMGKEEAAYETDKISAAVIQLIDALKIMLDKPGTLSFTVTADEFISIEDLEYFETNDINVNISATAGEKELASMLN